MQTILFLALLVATLPGNQAVAPDFDKKTTVPAARVPGAPADLLKLALDINGLDGTPTAPWHIKISYDEYDEDGDNAHSGTIDEFYESPSTYKQIIDSDTLKQTNFATPQGLYRSGDQGWPFGTEHTVRNAILRPLHSFRLDPDLVVKLVVKKDTLKLSNLTLPCARMELRESTRRQIGLPKVCFEPETAMVRFVAPDLSADYIYNNIVKFQNRYVARDVQVSRFGKVSMKIHVEELGNINNVDASLFVPPQGSSGPLHGRIMVPGNVLNEYLLSEKQVEFPRGVNGKTHVTYVIGKDGSVIDATATEGPKELQTAVVKAVRKFKYRPFMILNETFEVESTMEFQVNSR